MATFVTTGYGDRAGYEAAARPRGVGRPRTRPGRVLGDKAYSSRAIRSHLRTRHNTATIPEPTDQRANCQRRRCRGGRPPAFDPDAYKGRNTVERTIGNPATEGPCGHRR